MKKRILFVEDNDVMLQMYVMMLDGDIQWEVAGVPDAKAALRLMAKWPADVVLSDLRMPGMSGVELLGEIRKLYPRTSRIVVSGIEDQEEIASSLGETHQFLAKPFSVRKLKAVLKRLNSLDAYLSDEKLKSLVGQLKSLPTFPTLYVELMKEIESLNSSIERIAELIGKDPSLTAKMLQVVNSAAMGFSDKIHAPFQAVQQLGMNTVRSLALSAHVFSRFEQTPLKGFSVSALWTHLMNTAALARKIMLLEGAEASDADDAYTAALLHDIGKLMLAENLPEQFQNALARASKDGVAAPDAELEIFGATHAGVAAYLLGLWGLPAPIVEAIALHHTPEKTELWEFTPLTAVHVADILEKENSKSQLPASSQKINMDYLAKIGFAEHVDEWRSEAAGLFAREMM
jgi:HD-like signal output (HDOD) protein